MNDKNKKNVCEQGQPAVGWQGASRVNPESIGKPVRQRASALGLIGITKKKNPGQQALVASNFHEQSQAVPMMTGSLLR